MQVNEPNSKKISNNFIVTLRIAFRQVKEFRAQFCSIVKLIYGSDRSRSGSLSPTRNLDASKLRVRG